MADKVKQRQLKELLKLNTKLRSLYDNDEYFRRLYETCNKCCDNIDDELKNESIILTMGNGKHIFSEVSNDVINFLGATGHFNKNIFDHRTKTINISDYWCLIETIKYLIDILSFDLGKAFIESDIIVD